MFETLSSTARPGRTTRTSAGKMGTTATHPYAGGDTRNSTAWHAEFQDVNNDGFMDLFVTKGNVEAMEEFAAKDPTQPAHRPAGSRPSSRAREDAGIVDFARGRGAAVVDFNLDGLLDIVEVDAPRERPPVAGRRRGHRRRPGADGSLGRCPPPAARGRTATPSAPGSASRSASGSIERELTVGGGHAGGQLGWTHFGLGPVAGGAGPASSGRTARSAPGKPWRPTASRSSNAAPTPCDHGRRAATERSADRDQAVRSGTHGSRAAGARHPARLRHADRHALRAGRRRTQPAWKRCGNAPGAAAIDHIVVYADREHSANMSLPDRLRPSLRGGHPRRRPRRRSGHPGRQRVLRRWPARQPLPMRRILLPGPQPARPAA